MIPSPLILCIETSTKACSVAIGQSGKLLALKESVDEQFSHAEKLTVFIEEACKEASIALKQLDAIAVSKGPGSYTGLRIGVSAAKGLCYALDKPLIAVNTLQGMAAGCSHLPSSPSERPGRADMTHVPSFLCPMIDARRMEVYCAVYDTTLKEILPTSALVVDENSFTEILSAGPVLFFGDGSEKCKALIRHSNAKFIDGFSPSAQYLLLLAEKAFTQKQFEDLAYFEPYYLKDFVSGSVQKK